MSAPLPIVARYEGEGLFQALGRSKREAEAEYVIGEVYRFTRYEERSEASHRHYFAQIHEDWSNLPEDLAERFPTSEKLRKFALIKTGYATQRQLVASSRAEALRLAAFVAPMDEYALVETRGAVVTVWEAESQSMRAMGRSRFEQSKRSVLDYAASLIGVSADDLIDNSASAA